MQIVGERYLGSSNLSTIRTIRSLIIDYSIKTFVFKDFILYLCSTCICGMPYHKVCVRKIKEKLFKLTSVTKFVIFLGIMFGNWVKTI